MRNIGGNVGDGGLGDGWVGDKVEGWVAHVSADHVHECGGGRCLLLAVYQCVCFDISVSYRAAVSP